MSEPNRAPEEPFDDADEFDLACSSCNADLSDDDLFLTYRVCKNCRRHFWIPARERIELLVDDGSFQETSAELVSIDPLLFHDRLPVADRLAEARDQPSVAEAVITGTGAIGGHQTVLIVLDLAVLSVGIGIVAGEKIALAMEHAVTRRLPVVAICSGGSGKGQEGVLALAQAGKLASAASRLRRVGVPLIAVLTHPTSGNVLAGVAGQADFIFAEPGAHIGAAYRGDAIDHPVPTAESLLPRGLVDAIVDRTDLRTRIETLLGLVSERGRRRSNEAPPVASATGITPVREELAIARRPNRPTARDYVDRIATEFIDLRGDRAGTDHPAIFGGIGRIDGLTAIVVGVQRNEWQPAAAAFSKVNRFVRLAAHLELSIVAFVETGAVAGVEDPVAAQVMAQTSALLAAVPIPVVSIAIGETAGLAGMVLLSGDRVMMQEHAVMTQQTGDPLASSRECLRLGLVDALIPEAIPAGEDFESAVSAISAAASAALAELAGMGPRRLIDDRTRRFRRLGLSTAEGREAARSEWRELQDLQRMITRSIGDIRERWEHRQINFPAMANRPALPQMHGRPSLPAINLPKINIRRPDLTELTNRVAATRRGLSARDQRDATPEEDGSSDKV